MRKRRWTDIAVGMQSGMNALSLVTTIRRQFEDAILAHQAMSATRMRERVTEMLNLVNIDPGLRTIMRRNYLAE